MPSVISVERIFPGIPLQYLTAGCHGRLCNFSSVDMKLKILFYHALNVFLK